MVISDILLKYYGKEVKQISKIEIGLINETYKLVTSSGNYIFQKINCEVFKNYSAIINNENQLRELLTDQGNNDFLVKIIPNLYNDNFTQMKGELWRLTAFIENSYAPVCIESNNMAFQIGTKIKEFHEKTNESDISIFKEVIPHFHDLNFRLKAFEATKASASKENMVLAKELFQKSIDFAWLQTEFDRLKSFYKLRLCHNDTKASNFLFDLNTKEIRYLIDLDTVMPGYIFTDIGDAIRSGCSMSDESESIEDCILFNPEFMESIICGYFNSGKFDGTLDSHKDMLIAGMIMLYMQAIRFLTDFLDGNKYFTVNNPMQNLIRARNQFLLLQQLDNYFNK